MPQKKVLSTVSIKDDSIQFLDDFFNREPSFFQRRIKIPLPGEVSSIELTLYLPKPFTCKALGFESKADDLDLKKINHYSFYFPWVTQAHQDAFFPFMTALWIYNDGTAKSKKSMAEMEEINKMMMGECPATEAFKKAVSLLHNSQLYQNAFNEGLVQISVKQCERIKRSQVGHQRFTQHLKQYFSSAASEKTVSHDPHLQMRERLWSGGCDLMASAMSVITGINIDDVYQSAVGAVIQELVDHMASACGSFNDALSLKKEYDRGEISKEDMPASPENYSREQMRKYHQSLDQFYTVKQELHSKMKGLNSTLRSDVKKFVLMIEGTLAGVQTWSLFLTDRYLGPSENPSRSVLALLQDLNQEEALPLSVLKGYDHKGLSLHLSEKIAALRGFSITSASTNDVLKTYINQESTSKHSHSRQDLMETVLGAIDSGDKKSILILGDSGSGKTLFTWELEKQLWYHNSEGKPVLPIRIELASLTSEEAVTMALPSALARLGFTTEHIRELQTSRYPLLVIFDGYDESKLSQNLYASNKLSEWNAVAVFTCRTEYSEVLNNPRLFYPHFGGAVRREAFDQQIICPFIDSQIKGYVQKFVDQRLGQDGWTIENYLTYMDEVPNIKHLISNPFVLFIVCTVLPRIVDQHAGQFELLDLTRSDLYRHFLEDWFERNSVKLEQSGKLPGPELDVIQHFKTFSLKLAEKMGPHVEIRYELPKRSFGTPLAVSEWDEFFGYSPDAELGRRGCPLVKRSELERGHEVTYFRFLHASVQEYLLKEYSVAEGINSDDSDLEDADLSELF